MITKMDLAAAVDFNEQTLDQQHRGGQAGHANLETIREDRGRNARVFGLLT